MRALRTAVVILGLFLPLVIQAQPFGDSEIGVFDLEFLTAPPGPPPVPPAEPPVPGWVTVVPEPAAAEGDAPPILVPELPA